MEKILIVDDEKNVLSSFHKVLSQDGYDIATAASAEEALQLVPGQNWDLVIMDIRMPGLSGIEAVVKIKQIDPKLPVILMTAFGTIDTAVEAMKAGAFEYIIKPFDVPEMKRLIVKALEVSRLMKVEVSYEPEQSFKGDRIVGHSLKMQQVYKLVGQVADSDVNILLRGESGVGKELVARAIYFHSRLRSAPFIVINSAAIPDALLESELFGHEKGAFTDAKVQRIGKLEQCQGGTLFLDEIGDMSPAIQAKVLRVMEDKSFERLGGNKTVKVEVRIITATNKNLERLVKEGKFREDLYYRLNAVTILIPPLRERREDIPAMVEYFLKKYSRDFGKDMHKASAEALQILGRQEWPGNVRELENVVKKAVLLGQGRVLLPDYIVRGDSDSGLGQEGQDLRRSLVDCIRRKRERDSGSIYADIIEEVEKTLILEILRQTEGNQSLACKLLGLSRPTLRDRIEKLGLKKSVQLKEE